MSRRRTIVSLKDVAQEVGLSVATVSRALAGSPNVNERTRERVREAADRIGYRSSTAARSIRPRTTHAIGLVIPDVTNYFYVSGAAVLQSVFEAEGYRLLVSMSNDQSATEAECLRALVEQRVDGIIHVPCTSAGAQPFIDDRRRTPIVELNRISDGGVFDAVLSDEYEGAKRLAEMLIEQGHRRLAVIAGGEQLSTTRDRVAGFREAHRAAGLRLDEELVLPGHYGQAWGAEAMAALAEREESWPTAVFASGSQLVLGALHALRERDIKVGRDISLVGFGDPSWYRVCCPPVTTWALPLRQMAMIAARLLLARINGDESLSATPTVVRLSGELVVRESSGKPRSRPSS